MTWFNYLWLMNFMSGSNGCFSQIGMHFLVFFIFVCSFELRITHFLVNFVTNLIIVNISKRVEYEWNNQKHQETNLKMYKSCKLPFEIKKLSTVSDINGSTTKLRIIRTNS